jgi:hypothetical protein
MRFILSTTLLVCLLVITVNAQQGCKPEAKPIYFNINQTLEQNLPYGFINEFNKELGAALAEIRFCLKMLTPQVLSDTTKHDDIVMYMSSENQAIDSFNSIIISILTINDWVKGDIGVSLEHPLISISYEPDELSTFRSVLIRKIIENVRTQYVCHLRIQSSPSDINITTDLGLEGKTPLEWIIPVGNITLKNKTDGYEPFQKRIVLDEPGIHTYFLDLKKKQFYNSRFIIPSVVFLLSSAACYYGEHYYYSRYSNFGRDEALNDPDVFGKTYNTAKKYETAKYASLALLGVSLTFSFIVK